MASDICKLLSSEERRLNLQEYSLKVIPQIESTAALVDLKEILTAGRSRFIAAAFGADDFTADF